MYKRLFGQSNYNKNFNKRIELPFQIHRCAGQIQSRVLYVEKWAAFAIPRAEMTHDLGPVIERHETDYYTSSTFNK